MSFREIEIDDEPLNGGAPMLTDLSNRMSDMDYDRERQRIREAYGDSRKEAGARYEQELAKLAHSTGWTQEKLAERESAFRVKHGLKPVKRAYMGQLLCFGRFLEFAADSSNLSNLTESKFRGFWAKTAEDKGNNPARYCAVVKMIEVDAEGFDVHRQSRPKIGRDIIAKFADGKWHSLDAIEKQIDADPEHVASTLANMHSRPSGTYGVKCERKQVGKSWSYRFFRSEKQVSSLEIQTKLAPIIEGLETEGKKSAATMSVGTVARLAHQLKRFVDEWGK